MRPMDHIENGLTVRLQALAGGLVPVLTLVLAASLLVSLPGLTARAADAGQNGVVASGEGHGPWSGHGASLHNPLKYGPDFTHFEYVNPDAPKGGVVKLGVQGGFDSLNPFVLRGTAAAGVSGLTYLPLMTGSNDEVFAMYGALAERIEFPADDAWVAFDLREEARWHDGVPITAEDVVWTFETLMSEGHPFFRSYYADIDRAEAEGTHRVKFTFTRPGNKELPLITGQMPVLPKHFWTAENPETGEPRVFDATTLEPPLGSGPYRVVALEANRSITFERVEDWWGQDLPVFKGQYNFDQITYDYYRDASVMLEAFKAGEFDFRNENTARLWANAYDVPAVERGDIVRETIEHDRPQGMQAFAFNLRRPLFQDRRVRRALIELFDFTALNRTVFFNQYQRTTSFFQNSELASSGMPDEAELAVLNSLSAEVPPEVFNEAYEVPEHDESGRDRRQLRTALGLLREAGWETRDGTLVNGETGEPFEFEILLNNPSFEAIALGFQRSLERVGITANIRVVDPAQYQERQDTFDYDMIVASFGQSLSPGNEQRDFWHSEKADEPGSRNLVGIRNPAVDELVELVIKAPDREAQIVRTRALDRVLLHNDYVIPQWHIGYWRVAYWNRFGHPEVNPPYGGPGFIDRWWYDPVAEESLSVELERRSIRATN